MGVGLEVGGQYANQFNICAGKGEEKQDRVHGDFCWLRCVIREFFEELKLFAPFETGAFDAFFLNKKTGRLRYFLQRRTPIFIALLPPGTSRATITKAMQTDLLNPALPFSHKEMRAFEFIRVDSGAQIEGKAIPVSSFADAVRRRIDVADLII